MNWRREMDAWLARECEGWSYRNTEPDQSGYWVDAVGAMRGLSEYSTDPAAAIRAAEAWRKQDQGRWYECRSGFIRKDGTEVIAMAQCFKWAKIVGTGDSEAALAQALLKATGWPG